MSVNLQPIIEANDLDDLASKTAENFDTLESMLPTSVIDALDRWPGVPASFSFTIGHADLTEATNGAYQNVALLTVPAGCAVEKVRVKHSTAFSGGGATSVTVQIGTSGTADRFAGELAVSQSVGDGAMVVSEPMEMPVGSSTPILARFTPDGSHNLAALTAGSLTVVITLSKAQ